MADRTVPSYADSEAAFLKAKLLMPGGVSSPVRAFKAVGGTPVFIREGEGAHLKDIDGNEYIDYVCSYGPLIAGHANERLVAALSKDRPVIWLGNAPRIFLPEEDTGLTFECMNVPAIWPATSTAKS